MGHNSVVLGHLKSTGIPRVDRMSTGPPDLGGLMPLHLYDVLTFVCLLVQACDGGGLNELWH